MRGTRSPRRWPRLRRLAFWTALLAGLCVWPAAHAGSALVVSHPIDAPDAILVLASHEWERIPAAARLARHYPGALILLTAPRLMTARNCHLCGQRQQWLEHEGVAAERILILPRLTMNTFDEAQAAREFLADDSPKRLLVVTTGYHTRRAWATFKGAFAGTAVTIGIVPATPSQGRPERWWATPYDRHYVRYEWAALLKYRLKYDIRG